MILESFEHRDNCQGFEPFILRFSQLFHEPQERAKLRATAVRFEDRQKLGQEDVPKKNVASDGIGRPKLSFRCDLLPEAREPLLKFLIQ